MAKKKSTDKLAAYKKNLWFSELKRIFWTIVLCLIVVGSVYGITQSYNATTLDGVRDAIIFEL